MVMLGKYSWKSTNLAALTDTTDAATGFTAMEQRFELDKTYGLRGFRVVRPDGGSPTVGQWLSQEIASTTAASVASASTTTTINTTGLTAHAFSPLYVPCWAVINDDAAAAGAAPEGECKPISDNSATVITVSSAFSAAPAASDTYSVIRLGVAEDSAVGDGTGEVLGCVMATTVTNDYYCFVQHYGFNPNAVAQTTTAIAAGSKVQIYAANAAGALTSATTGKVGLVGVALGNARASDAVRTAWPMFIALL